MYIIVICLNLLQLDKKHLLRTVTESIILHLIVDMSKKVALFAFVRKICIILVGRSFDSYKKKDVNAKITTNEFLKCLDKSEFSTLFDRLTVYIVITHSVVGQL